MKLVNSLFNQFFYQKILLIKVKIDHLRSKNAKVQEVVQKQITFSSWSKENSFLSLEEKFSSLQTRISSIQHQIKQNNDSLWVLEGNKRAQGKAVILAHLIKYFYRHYFQHDLIKLKRKNFILIEDNKQLNQILYQLYRSKILDLGNAIDSGQKEFSPEDLQFTFESENFFRGFLEAGFKVESDNQEEFYAENVMPLKQQAKYFLCNRFMHATVVAAALKGEALQTGIKTLDDLVKKNKLILTADMQMQSANKVLIPIQAPERAIFKKNTPQAQEQEDLIDGLFNFHSLKNVVSSFTFRRLMPQRFGIDVELSDWDFKLNLNSKMKSYSFTHLSPELVNQFSKKLRPLDHPFIQNKKNLKQSHFIPYFPNDEIEQAYEICAKSSWSYQSKLGGTRILRFPEVHHLLLQGEELNHLQPISTSIKKSPIDKTLNVAWKLIFPEILYKDEKGHLKPLENVQAKPFIDRMIILKDIPSTLLQSLTDRLDAQSELIAILTGEFQFLDLHSSNLGIAPKMNEEYQQLYQTVFSYSLKSRTWEQLMEDCNKGWLFDHTIIHYHENSENSSASLQEGSVELIKILETKKFHKKGRIQKSIFENMTFNYEVITTLKEFHFMYLTADLSRFTSIKYRDPDSGLEVTTQLKKLEGKLKKALDVEWEWIIFDTDLTLSEDNKLLRQVVHYLDQEDYGKECGWIPLRSALLSTKWKDQPLKQVVVDQLMHSEQLDERIKKWIYREDAPIRQRLSKQDQNELNKRLKPFLEKPEYTLSFYREKNSNVLISDIKKSFASDLSNINKTDNRLFWNWLQSRLPHTFKDKEQLTLFSFAAEKIRKRLAMELFPRVTWRQRDALLERQDKKRNYLKSYNEIKTVKGNPDQILNKLHSFLEKEAIPLSKKERDQFLTFIQQNRGQLISNSEQLKGFQKKICKKCVPTYFNMMKVMYPLLADVYELTSYIMDDPVEVGKNIGFYKFSIEEIIEKIREIYRFESEAYQLSLFIEEKIKHTQPCFIGHIYEKLNEMN